MFLFADTLDVDYNMVSSDTYGDDLLSQTVDSTAHYQPPVCSTYHADDTATYTHTQPTYHTPTPSSCYRGATYHQRRVAEIASSCYQLHTLCDQEMSLSSLVDCMSPTRAY